MRPRIIRKLHIIRDPIKHKLNIENNLPLNMEKNITLKRLRHFSMQKDPRNSRRMKMISIGKRRDINTSNGNRRNIKKINIMRKQLYMRQESQRDHLRINNKSIISKMSNIMLNLHNNNQESIEERIIDMMNMVLSKCSLMKKNTTIEDLEKKDIKDNKNTKSIIKM